MMRMEVSIIVCLVVIVGVKFRSTDGLQADQEVYIPDESQNKDLVLQNFLAYFAEEEERLSKDLGRLQALVLEMRGANSSYLDVEQNNSLTVIEGNGGPSLQKLLESFLKVQQLETSLNETRAKAEQLRVEGENCETKAEQLNGKVQNLTEEMEHLKFNTIKKLVTTFNRQRIWRALRTGLEAVMDPDSVEYSQLQKLGYDQTYPLKKVSTESGWEPLLEMLLDAGLDPDMVVGPNDWTMLHYSTYYNKIPIAQKLLDHGAHMEMRNDERRSPLVQTAYDNRLPGLKLLVEHGAYVNNVDNYGRSSLHYTAMYNYLEAAKFLINHGALIDIKNNDGKTARTVGGSNSVGTYLATFES